MDSKYFTNVFKCSSKLILFVCLIFFGHKNVLAQFEVLSVYPEQNSIIAGSNDNIEIEFNAPVNTNTINSSTVPVYGSKTGKYAGSFSYDGTTNTLTFNPSYPFKAGEILSVTVTSDVQSAGGQSLSSSFLWQFTVRTEFGSGDFYDPEIVSLRPQSQPVAIYATDLNGNFFPDIATVNFNNGLVSILENPRFSGGVFGTFAVTQEIETGSAGSHITGGDLTGNGYSDLVITNTLINTVTILRNQGTGNFDFEIVTFSTGERPITSVIGDFNNNGLNDIAVAAAGSDNVAVHINQGNAQFSAPIFYAVGSSPISLKARDFNNNGYLDIAVTIAGDDQIDILLNDGTGVFDPITSIAIPFSPAAMEANVLIGSEDNTYGDGMVDLIVGARDYNKLMLIRNIGGNDLFTIDTEYELQASSPVSGIALASVDTVDGMAQQAGLGKKYGLDVITSHFSSNQLQIMFNRANQEYSPDHNMVMSDISSPFGIVTTDFTLDGAMDIAVTNYNDGQVTIILSTCGQCTPIALLDFIDFGDVCVGAQAEDQFTITNDAIFPLNISLSIQGDVFSTDEQTFRIEPEQSRNVTVFFEPDEIGVYQGVVLVSGQLDDGSSIEPVAVALQGRGVAAELTASVDHIDFGEVIALQSSTQSFTLQNDGNIASSIITMENQNPVFEVMTDLDQIAGTSSQNVQVEFNPTEEGDYNDILYIVHGDQCSTQPDTIMITMEGQALPLMPDLIAEEITVSTTEILVNETHSVTGVISNQYEAVGESFRTVITLQGEIVVDTTFAGIGVDEVIAFSSEVEFPALGRQELRLIVDYDNEIEELTTANNEISTFVTVERGTQVVVRPNPFTPNNDGYNDRVGINYEHLGLLNPRLKIYSIEGRLLHTNIEPEGLTLYWDGLDDSGREQRPGVYLFMLEDGNEVVTTGTVTLAR